MSSQTPQVVSVAKTIRINLQNGKLGQRPSNSYSKCVVLASCFVWLPIYPSHLSV